MDTPSLSVPTQSEGTAPENLKPPFLFAMNEKAVPIGGGRGIGAELAKVDRGFGKPMFGGSDGRLSQGIPARVGYDNDALNRRGGSWIIRSPFTPSDDED